MNASSSSSSSSCSNFNASCERARLSAALLNKRRSLDWCNITPSTEQQLLIVPANQLEQHKDWQLVCPSLERRPVTDYAACNVEVQLPHAIFARADTTSVEQETIKHLFSLISDRFGAHGKFVDVFALFGEYQKGEKNVLFDVSLPGYEILHGILLLTFHFLPSSVSRRMMPWNWSHS